jgi:vacuolar-type H+-ATPase subunit E/Vma4
MTVEKKLEMFSDITMNEVEEKRRKIQRDSGEKLRSAADEAVRAAEKSAQERLREERYAIDKLNNKQTVAASAEAKRSLIKLRDKLTEELFADIEADVRAFTESAEYESYLTDEINAAVHENAGRYTVLLVLPRDLGAARRIAAAMANTQQISVETGGGDITGEDFIGGFKLASADRRAMADYTLSARLRAERERFPIYYKEKME